MTTNIDRAADVIYGTLSGKYGDFGHHEDAAQALADAGLLAPAPQIIRSKTELRTLDPDTLVLDAAGYTVRYGSQVTRWDLPLAIIRDGAEVRAARKALEEA